MSSPVTLARRSPTGNASDFQEAQISETNVQVHFFSEVETTGTKIIKNGAKCQGKQEPHHWKLPPLLLGLHLMELVTLGLLTVHCVPHCHTFATYLKSSYLKLKQRATEEQARKEAEESEKIERQVQEWMKKERESLKLNPSFELENMGVKTPEDRTRMIYKINYVIHLFSMFVGS